MIYLFIGCAIKQDMSEMINQNAIKYEQEEAEKLGLTVVEYRKQQERERKIIQKKEEFVFLNKLAQYEIDYLREYEEIKKQMPKTKIVWVQPKNKKDACKVYVAYEEENPLDDDSYRLFWDGQCKDGYAHGLGREIEKANLIDRWQIGVYEKGMPKDSYINNNILYNIYIESESNYGVSEYQVIRKVYEKNNDIDIKYYIGTSGSKDEPALRIMTSPFFENTYYLFKEYPNFKYQIKEQGNDTQFVILNKENKAHGWGFQKQNNSNLKNIIFNNGLSTFVATFPDSYYEKAYSIVDEIKIAQKKALEAQDKAQLVKKQYLKKICGNSIKIDFMDNDEYKEPCEGKYEKELFAKINAKLQKVSQEKIAKLEQQRNSELQKRQEQYRQQQLIIEKKKLAIQQAQAEAFQNAADSAAWQNFNQSIQNMNYNNQMQQLNNNLFMMRKGY